MVSESHASRLSFYGRLADNLTRQMVRVQDITVSLEGDRQRPLLKQDGYFVFADLEPSVTDYRFRIAVRSYQDRTIVKALPANTAVELIFPGEDELYLSIVEVKGAQNQVMLEKIPFVPTIEAGATVIGEGGFTATLAEPLGGHKVSCAELSTVVGLASGQLLRIVRSASLMVRPGPYYPFPAKTTLVAVKVVEKDPVETPIGDTAVEITQVNATAPTTVNVGGLNLSRINLGGNPPAFLILDNDDKKTSTNDRGDAVFYFPGYKNITSLQLVVSKNQYQTATSTINITTKSPAMTHELA
jgi:hypothetical protein